MPQLTVFLVRHGQTVEEAGRNNDGALRPHQCIDPPLTETGYQQAQECFINLIRFVCDKTPVPANRGDADNDGVIDPLRNLACFSAPLKACQSTAAMLSAANMAAQDKLTWRYTTVDAATSPAAVPILTVNDLARHYPTIQQCGGIEAVVAAGLLHGAAAAWNDARPKCPLVQIINQDIKALAQPMVSEWKADRTVHPPRRVLDVQFLRLADNDDPWSLEELSPKVNVVIDLLPPNKYLTPPRHGNLNFKLPGADNPIVQDLAISPTTAVGDCVFRARQTGCDTVFLVVPSVCMDLMIHEASGQSSASNTISACSVLTLLANVEDAQGPDGIRWEFVGLFDNVTLATVPLFPGPVDCIVPPDPDKDPASVPANQWSKFPPPLPENIPDDYPDLPPFSRALNEPIPNVTPLREGSGGASRSNTTPGGRGSSSGRGSPVRPPPAGAGRGGSGPGPTSRGAPQDPLGRPGPPSSPQRGGRSPAGRGGGPTTRSSNSQNYSPTGNVHHQPASPTRLPKTHTNNVSSPNGAKNKPTVKLG